MKFSIKDFFSKCDQITITEEILNGKLHFSCSVLLFLGYRSADISFWKLKKKIAIQKNIFLFPSPILTLSS